MNINEAIIAVINTGFVIESKVAYGPNIWKIKDENLSPDMPERIYQVQELNIASYEYFSTAQEAAKHFLHLENEAIELEEERLIESGNPGLI